MGGFSDFFQSYVRHNNPAYRKQEEAAKMAAALDVVNNDPEFLASPENTINALIDTRNPGAVNAAVKMLETFSKQQQTIRGDYMKEMATQGPYIGDEQTITGPDGKVYEVNQLRSGGLEVIGPAKSQGRTQSVNGISTVIEENASGHQLAHGDVIMPGGRVIKAGTAPPPAETADVQFAPVAHSKDLPGMAPPVVDTHEEARQNAQTFNTAQNKVGPVERVMQSDHPANTVDEAVATLATDRTRPQMESDTPGSNYPIVTASHFDVKDPSLLPTHPVTGEVENVWEYRMDELEPPEFPSGGGPGALHKYKADYDRYEKKLEGWRKLKGEFHPDVSRMKHKMDGTGEMSENIRQAMKYITPMTTGVARTLANVPFTKIPLGAVKGMDMNQLDLKLAPIKSKIALDMLLRLRELSPTGGALGDVSDKDIDLLMNSIASIDAAQTPEELRRSLLVINNSYERMLTNSASDFRTKHKIVVPNYTPSTPFFVPLMSKSDQAVVSQVQKNAQQVGNQVRQGGSAIQQSFNNMILKYLDPDAARDYQEWLDAGSYTQEEAQNYIEGGPGRPPRMGEGDIDIQMRRPQAPAPQSRAQTLEEIQQEPIPREYKWQ